LGFGILTLNQKGVCLGTRQACIEGIFQDQYNFYSDNSATGFGIEICNGKDGKKNKIKIEFKQK